MLPSQSPVSVRVRFPSAEESVRIDRSCMLACFLALAGPAMAEVDCSPLAPSTGVDRDVEGKLSGKAELLLKSIGSTALDGEYKNIQKDVLHEYPNADELVMWKSFLYVTCSLVANSRQWDDNQKFDKYMAIMDRWRQPPPPVSPSPVIHPTPSPAPFNGEGWAFDIFYCTSPDGDASSSKRVALRLADALRPQNGVGRLRVKPWPHAGTEATNNLGTFVYAASQSPIEIKVTPQRENMAENLKTLWMSISADSGPIGTAVVGSNYQNYISTVVCEHQ